MKINIKDIKGVITQRFHDKHFGVDIDNGHGSSVRSYWDVEYVYKILTVENPSNDGTGFTGVFTLVEQDGEVFEFLYGHCNPLVKVGAVLTKGTVLGTQSNNGESYWNGIRITLDMQKAGDTRGSHQHNQARVLRKDQEILPNTRYLTNYGGGHAQKDGFYFAIPNFSSHNGCVNWLDETRVQPTIVKPSYTKSTFFTLMEAVKAYQISKGILDFANETDLKKIRIGEKTLRAIEQDKLK
jgi:hypothetical protein